MGEVVGYKVLRALRAERRMRREETISITPDWQPRRESHDTARPLLRGALASRVVARYGAWDEV